MSIPQNINAEKLFSSIPSYLMVLDVVKGTIVYCNRDIRIDLGHAQSIKSNDLICSWQSLLHPQDISKVKLLEDELLLCADLERKFSCEVRLENSHGNWIWYLLTLAALEFSEQGLVEKKMVSLTPIQSIVSREQMFHDIVEFAVDGFVIGDSNGIVVKTNQRFLEIVGLSREQVEGVHIKTFFSSNVLKEKPLRFDLIMQGETVVNEREINRPDGTVVYIEMHSKQMPDGTYQSIVRDITDRRMADKAIVESQEKFKMLFDYANDAIFLMNDQVFLDCNLKTEEIFGCSKDKLIGNSPVRFSPELQHDGVESKVRAKEMMERAVAGESMFFEWIHLKYDGTPFFAEVSLNRLNLGEGIAVQAIVRDVSSRKNFEDKILKSENLYRSIIENIEDVYYRFNLSRKLMLASPSAARLFGYSSADEMQNLSLDDFWVNKDEKERFLSLIRQNERVKEFEATLVTRSGNLIIASLSASYYKDENGKTQGVEGIIRDITVRKNAELALAQEQFLMHNLMNNVVDQIYFKDIDSKFVRVSHNVAKRFGFNNVDDVIGKSDFDFFDKEHAQNAYDVEQIIIATGKPIVDVEEKETWPNGRVTWVSTTKMPYYNNEGVLVGTFGISRDITERKNNEIALRKREERAQKQRTAIAILATEGLPSESNLSQAYRTVTEVSAKVLNVRRASVWTFSDDLKELKCVNLYELGTNTHSAGQSITAMEFPKYFELLTKEHRIFALNALSDARLIEFKEIYLAPLNISSLLDAGILVNGKLVGLIRFEHIGEPRVWEVDEESFASTIASLLAQTLSGVERVRVEEALRHSEKRFRMVIDATNDAIWDWDLKTDKIFLSDRYYKMLGYSPNDLQDNFNSWIKLMHPHDAAYSEVMIKKYILGKQGEFNLEYRLQTKDGSWRWVHTRGKIVESSKNGDPLRLVGTHMDITDRKLVEEELRESQSLLQSVLDTIPVRVFWKDRNLRYMGCNQWFASDAGLKSPEEIIGLSDFDLSWKNDAPSYHTDDLAVMKTGTPKLNFEESQLTPGGSIMWLRTSKIPLRDSNSNIIGVLGSYDDITESKKSAELVALERAYFEQLFETSPEGIVVLDINDNVLRCNQEFSNIFGFSQDEMEGRPINSFIVPVDLEDEGLGLTHTVASGDTVMHETVRQRKDGSLVHVSILGKPIYFKGGRLAVYGIYRDISDRKKVEEELVFKSNEVEAQNEEYRIINEELYVAKQKAEESDRLKSAFLANMSHEIRTPMNGILGFSQLLVNPNVPEVDVKQYVDVIQSCGNQLLSIINDLIDISKIEANQVSITESDTNINSILHEQFLLFQSKAEQKGVALEYSFDLPIEKASIITDSSRLKQIITNLLGNAIKFTRKGYVKFGYTCKSNYIEFFVEDSGIGISAENYDGIFERFHQVETTFSEQAGGTGLGLAISKAFINKLGGDIWVVSEMGKGSKFLFTLPYRPSKSVIDIDVKQTLTQLESVPQGSTLLVAEDDDINFFYLKEMLSVYPLNVLRASTGFEAIEMVKNFPDIELVLMDIKMPGMDGLDATREVKKLRMHLPIIAQTAYAFSSDKEKAYQAGCDDYISKPLDRVKLVALMAKYLGKK